jgi:hypothetical protein
MDCDSVLAEIRRVREAYADEFAGDIRAMLADLRRRQQEGGRQVIARTPKRLKTPSQASPAWRAGRASEHRTNEKIRKSHRR